MKLRILALLSPLLVAGCAPSLPFQIASWAIDGISYLATQKSIAEHGLSIATEKDCEILRGVLGGGFCVDDVVPEAAIAAFEENPADSASMMVSTLNAGKAGGFDDPFDALVGGEQALSVAEILDVDVPKIVVALFQDPGFEQSDAAPRADAFASADAAIAAFDDTPPIENASFDDPGGQASAFVVAATEVAELDRVDVGDTKTEDGLEFLANFSTASGGPVAEGSDVIAGSPGEANISENMAVDAISVVRTLQTTELTGSTIETKDASGATVWVPTQDGLYFVIGSFGYLDNARRAAVVFASLGPDVVSAEVKGRKMYRVVVGPFSEANKDIGERLLIKAGLYDTWSISLDSTTWTLVVENQGPSDEVASRIDRHDFKK